ncbi:transcriptional regulator [Candidatus Saccharibacteria bacterium]|nr:MAG: transcriptional regulator [Candidatus Saccharibacteria bacterium]
MVEQLFGSKTRVKLLQLFYSNPNRAFYVREITRKIDEQINSVRRELANLLSIGIISSDNNNNRLYYEVNQDYEFYQPLSVMFGGGVMAVPEAPAADSQANLVKALGNVELAFYTGQFTRDAHSGTDILIVGDVNQTKLSKFIAELEKQEAKELRYTVLSPQEFKYRKRVNDRFLMLVMASKKQVLVDKNDVFAEPKSKSAAKKAKPSKKAA